MHQHSDSPSAQGHKHHAHHHDHGDVSHGHHHSLLNKSSLNRAFIAGITLNAAFVLVEAVFGIVYNSMGLLSDAGHNLSDVFSLVLSLVAFRLMRKAPDEKHTYGYRKFSIQASLLNAIILLVAVGAILAESIDKLVHGVAVDGDAIAWVAGAGVVVNGLTTWLFLKDKEKDMNVKGAYLHMMADTMVSVGVVVAGVIIRFTGWYFIDPIIGIIIALLIGWSTRNLLVESFRLAIDSVPSSISISRLTAKLEEVSGVVGVHHVHVWAISTTENAMTAHAVIEKPELIAKVVPEMHGVAEEFGISHSTFEVETDAHICDDQSLIASD